MPMPTRGCKLMVEARETRGGTQSRPKITKIAVLVNGLNINKHWRVEVIMWQDQMNQDVEESS